MKTSNYINMEFPSRSSNEGFARAAVACFAAQMDPTLNELGGHQDGGQRGGHQRHCPRLSGLRWERCSVKARICPGNVLELISQGPRPGHSGRGARPGSRMFTTGGEERSGMGFTIMESFMDQLTVSVPVPGKGTTRGHAQARLGSRMQAGVK